MIDLTKITYDWTCDREFEHKVTASRMRVIQEVYNILGELDFPSDQERNRAFGGMVNFVTDQYSAVFDEICNDPDLPNLAAEHDERTGVPGHYMLGMCVMAEAWRRVYAAKERGEFGASN